MARLVDKYRPRTIEAVLGHRKVKDTLLRVLERPDFDRGAFLITGPTGTGKTSLALALALRVCGDETNIQEVNGSTCQVPIVREIARDMQRSTLFGGGWKAYVINEAQSMSSQAVQIWLSVLDTLPPRRVVCFTSTRMADGGQTWLFTGASNEYLSPFVTRCDAVLELSADADTVSAMARGLQDIAKAENLDGATLGEYEDLLRANAGSMREALNAVQRGEIRTAQTAGARIAAYEATLREYGADK